MRYTRTYRIQAAHFNSQTPYDVVWGLAPHIEMVTKADLLTCARDVHGHNFKIVLVLEGECGDDDWLVDDVSLEAVVMEWENTNLSMHRDFVDQRYRATTERMAEVLLRKLRGRFRELIKRVDVYENDDIHATAEGR